MQVIRIAKRADLGFSRFTITSPLRTVPLLWSPIRDASPLRTTLRFPFRVTPPFRSAFSPLRSAFFTLDFSTTCIRMAVVCPIQLLLRIHFLPSIGETTLPSTHYIPICGPPGRSRSENPMSGIREFFSRSYLSIIPCSGSTFDQERHHAFSIVIDISPALDCGFCFLFHLCFHGLFFSLYGS